MKATHKGHCQCCGRLQMLPGGVLSKHGYTVDFGYFSGVCRGAGELPFEQSIDLIKGFIDGAAKFAEEMRAKAAEEMISTDKECMVSHYHKPSGHRYDKGGYRWIKVVLTENESGYTASYEVDGKVHQNVGWNIKSYHERYARHLIKQAEEAEQYCQWQRQRIKGWKPSPLTPVKAA